MWNPGALWWAQTVTWGMGLSLGLIGAAVWAQPAPSDPLDGTTWTLRQLSGHVLLPGKPPTLRLEDGRASGSDGCNRYSTAYTAEGRRFRVDERVVSTKRGCASAVMQLADAYLRMLTDARSAQITGSQLTLLGAQGQVLAQLAAQGGELVGSSWQVQALNNGRQALVSVPTDRPWVLSFQAEGRLAGQAPCNPLGGRYELTGARLVLRPEASTRNPCTRPVGVMAQEAQFLRTLAQVSGFRIESGQLELRLPDGSLAATLAPVDPEPAPPAGPTPLQASGHEPSWRLTLDSQRLSLQAHYGQVQVQAPTPVPELAPGSRRYALRTPVHEVQVLVSDRPCADAQTGWPHPHSVTIWLDGFPMQGCGGDPWAVLQAGVWVVEELQGAAPVPGAQVTLLFGRDGRITGNASCNAYTGGYRSDGEGVTVSGIAVTTQRCSPALMRQETRFLDGLKQLQRVSLHPDGSLALQGREGRHMLVRRL